MPAYIPKATNHDIAHAFSHIAELLSLLEENGFKIRAYSHAAAIIEGHHEELGVVFERDGRKGLQEISGVGHDLALKIEELLSLGHLEYLRDLQKKVPKGLLEILKIEGMGPVKTRFVWKRFDVKNLKNLEKLLASGKLAAIRGWGEKSVSNILRGIELMGLVGKRIPLPTAYKIAHAIREALKRSDLCEKVEVAGSIRRMKDTVGDIDILATTEHPLQVMDLFVSLPYVREVTLRGITRSTVHLKSGLQADLRVVAPHEFGAALYYFTGSKDHNVSVRQWAVKNRMTVSEYGVYAGTKSKKGKLLAAETEKDVFHVLGMDYVAPELRENRGEIEAAREHALPKLIEVKDLCGDLHAHSTVSDGVDTMTDMARAAQNAGLTYIVITDHASTIGLVKGIKERTVGDYLKKIDAVKRRVPGIHIIAGAEVDILETGQLYLSDAALSHLEWVVASVHSSFRQSEKEMTARILRAIQNPHVSMIGHPTARLLGRRAPVAFDTGAVFKAAAKAGVALEVSASPFRLDLDDIRAREAKEAGVELAIASDAHGVDGFDFRFGVGQARRGWLTKHDVLNALPWAEFKKRL